MRTPSRAFLIVAAAAVLTGCGGSAQPPSGVATGRATFTVIWPPATKLIPAASNSIVVQVKRGGSVVSSQLLPRPVGGGSASATFDPLPVGNLTATANAYPNADGSGVAQAAATVPLPIQPNQTTSFSLIMSSTIDHLEIAPASPAVTVGQQIQLTATAKDASGNVVLTSAFQWFTPDTSYATVDQNGLVTGIAGGSARITVTETESHKSMTVTVTVATVPAPPFAYEGFAYNPGGGLANQNGGTGAWGGSWNEFGQGNTSSVIVAGSLAFGNLLTSGNAVQTTSDRPIGHDRFFNTTVGQTGTVLWISWLMKPLDAMNAGSPNTYFGLNFGGVFIGKGGGSSRYGMETDNSGGAGLYPSSVVAVQGQTVFLVVRITFRAGADIFDLWVNPTPGQSLPATPDVSKPDVDSGIVSDFHFGCSIRCIYDEIRFGRSYAEVAPTQ